MVQVQLVNRGAIVLAEQGKIERGAWEEKPVKRFNHSSFSLLESTRGGPVTKYLFFVLFCFVFVFVLFFLLFCFLFVCLFVWLGGCFSLRFEVLG